MADFSFQHDRPRRPTNGLRAPLLELACRSAMLRIVKHARRHRTSGTPHPNDADDWDFLNNSLRIAMEQLGRSSRDSGEDLRESPLWQLLERQWAYEKEFEPRPRTNLIELAPSAIYSALIDRRTVLWRGWEIALALPREPIDEFGVALAESQTWAVSPGGTLRMFRGMSPTIVRDICFHMLAWNSRQHAGAPTASPIAVATSSASFASVSMAAPSLDAPSPREERAPAARGVGAMCK